jgi:PHP family Zn ribbon phosphoesterase
LAQVVDASMAQAIVKVRDGNAKVTPGYDGVYGQLVLGVNAPPQAKLKPKIIQPIVKQKSMTDFW